MLTHSLDVYTWENIVIAIKTTVCTHDATACAFISTDAVAFSNAHFGAGTGTIYLDDVGCTGNEINLTDCSQSSTVHCSSGHLQDAGVRCQGLKGAKMLHGVL